MTVASVRILVRVAFREKPNSSLSWAFVLSVLKRKWVRYTSYKISNHVRRLSCQKLYSDIRYSNCTYIHPFRIRWLDDRGLWLCVAHRGDDSIVTP